MRAVLATCTRGKLGQTRNQNQNYSSVTAASNKIIEQTQLFPFLSLSTPSRVTDQHKSSDRDGMRPAPLKKYSETQ